MLWYAELDQKRPALPLKLSVQEVGVSRKQQLALPAGSVLAPEAAGHFVYLLACADGTLYTGYTADVARRLAMHNAGTGARYTRGRRPVTLVTCWAFPSKSDALRAELAIKALPRAEKLRLAQKKPVCETVNQADTQPGG